MLTQNQKLMCFKTFGENWCKICETRPRSILGWLLWLFFGFRWLSIGNRLESAFLDGVNNSEMIFLNHLAMLTDPLKLA